MTTRHLPAAFLTLSVLTLGIAGAADPPASKNPLAQRPPIGVPDDAAARQARLQQANRRLNRVYGKQAPAPKPTTIRIQEPGASRLQTTGASRLQTARPQPAVRTTASTATAVRPSTATHAAATTNRRAGRWPAVKPAAATATASRHADRQAARAVASRGAGRLVASTKAGLAGAAIVVGGALLVYGAAELSESGSLAELGASLEQTVSQGVNDLATGNVHIDARDAAGFTKDLLIGTPAALAVYGGSEIVLQEIADPGQTLRDIQSGNINVDSGEVIGLGAAVGASVALGGPAGLLAYGTVKIVDQEIEDPGKTARDIKAMTGGAVDLEQAGKDIEKTGQDLGKAAQDVGGFVVGLFGGSR